MQVVLSRPMAIGSANAARRVLACGVIFASLAGLAGFAAPAHASYGSELKFQESLQAFKSGDYKNAMLGFMDVVVAEPQNDLARNYLKESGRKVLEREDENVQLRRKELLNGAEIMKKRLNSLNELKTTKILEWESAFLRATSLAGSTDSLLEAVSAYEAFMRKTPIYAEMQDEFIKKDEIIRKTFYKAINDKYPDIARAGDSVADADPGGTFFTREILNIFSYKQINSGRTESVLAELSRIKNIRSEITILFNYEIRALALYSNGKFGEANMLFRKVLAVKTCAGAATRSYSRQAACGENEEAAFYSGLAAERTAAAALPFLPVVERPCLDGSCPASGKAAVKSGPRVASPVKRDDAVHEAAPGAEHAPGALARKPAASVTVIRKPGVKKNAPAASGPPPVEVSPADSAEAADKLYELGVRDFSVGNYSAAAKSWSECLRINPGHLKAKMGVERLKSIGGGQ